MNNRLQMLSYRKTKGYCNPLGKKPETVEDLSRQAK